MNNRLQVEDLTNWFSSGSKSKEKFGIGTEHEQFLYNRESLKRVPYEGEPGIKQILQKIETLGWNPINEGGNIIGLTKSGASITLEPGGQFELSGKNFKTVHETYSETKEHCDLITKLGGEMGFHNLPVGFDPFWKREDIPWMPKERYEYMKNWMPKKGSLGLDMMTRTSSIQVNLDFESEEDMVKKAQVAQAFQSVIMAIFANSPFKERELNGYKSYRSHIWDDTDNERCGFLSFIFQPNFGFERWTQYLLDVPMYFIHRDDKYSPANGLTFRQYMNDPQYNATIDDWEVHVSTVFPDIRLKKFIELRGADAGYVNMITSLAAFWVGLFYDETALNNAHSFAMELGLNNIVGLRNKVAKKGLDTTYNNIALIDISKEIFKFSKEGLKARAAEINIESEDKYLAPIEEILTTGKTTADINIENYNYFWGKDISQILKKSNCCD